MGTSIELNTPYEGEEFNYDDIPFNFTVTDQFGFATSLICNITLDYVLNVSNLNVTSGVYNL